VENEPSGQAQRESLSRALEQEHREIDEVIKGWADGTPPGRDERAALGRAVEELRRHIYAEEELLFPPLRDAGMVGPILVMLREHADMWPLLDALDSRLVHDGEDELLRTTCRKLLILLAHHNPKEEQILYPEIDRIVPADTAPAVHELREVGRIPADWTCQFLRAKSARG
jgi:iron-sulfur cluster repair protein YtfE (RIC family)